MLPQPVLAAGPVPFWPQAASHNRAPPPPPPHSHLPGKDLCRCLQPPLELTLTQGFRRAGLLHPEQDWGGSGNWGPEMWTVCPHPQPLEAPIPLLDSCVEPNTDCPPGCILVTPEGPKGLAQGQPRPQSDTRLLLPPSPGMPHWPQKPRGLLPPGGQKENCP